MERTANSKGLIGKTIKVRSKICESYVQFNLSEPSTSQPGVNAAGK